MLKNSERKGQLREEEEADREAKSRASARHAVLKGGRLDSSPSNPGPPCQQDFCPRSLPGETTAHSRDALVPAKYGLAESARNHDGAVMLVTSAEMPAPITAPTSPRLPRRNGPKLQRLQIKARERVSNSSTSSGATSGGCARTHPPRT
jgi:hypothetical protein